MAKCWCIASVLPSVRSSPTFHNEFYQNSFIKKFENVEDRTNSPTFFFRSKMWQKFVFVSRFDPCLTTSFLLQNENEKVTRRKININIKHRKKRKCKTHDINLYFNIELRQMPYQNTEYDFIANVFTSLRSECLNGIFRRFNQWCTISKTREPKK